MNWNWTVSFNDGSRVTAKNLMAENPKQNPFREGVLRILKDNPDKSITHIQLIVNGIRYNSPTETDKNVFGGSSSPREFYIIFKQLSELKGKAGGHEFIGITYKTGDYRNIHWVNVKDNSTYIQVFDTKNPKTKIEEKYLSLDVDISNQYKELNNG